MLKGLSRRRLFGICLIFIAFLFPACLAVFPPLFFNFGRRLGLSARSYHQVRSIPSPESYDNPPGLIVSIIVFAVGVVVAREPKPHPSD